MVPREVNRSNKQNTTRNLYSLSTKYSATSKCVAFNYSVDLINYFETSAFLKRGKLQNEFHFLMQSSYQTVFLSFLCSFFCGIFCIFSTKVSQPFTVKLAFSITNKWNEAGKKTTEVSFIKINGFIATWKHC